MPNQLGEQKTRDIFSYVLVTQPANIFQLLGGPSDQKDARLSMILGGGGGNKAGQQKLCDLLVSQTGFVRRKRKWEEVTEEPLQGLLTAAPKCTRPFKIASLPGL